MKWNALVATLALLAVVRVSGAQDSVQRVKRPEKKPVPESAHTASQIKPSDAEILYGFDAYSLFLVPSSEWKARQKDLSSLERAFDDFGEAIGDRKLAVWFTGSDGKTIDTEASKTYCDKFGLNYNNGPFVVTSRVYPDKIKPGDSVVITSLGGIDSNRIIRVLNVLTQDLRNEHRGIQVSGAAVVNDKGLLFEEVKQRLLSAVSRHKDELKGVATFLSKMK